MLAYGVRHVILCQVLMIISRSPKRLSRILNRTFIKIDYAMGHCYSNWEFYLKTEICYYSLLILYLPLFII